MNTLINRQGFRYILLSLACACGSIREPLSGPLGPVSSTNRLAYVGLSENVRLRLFLIGEDGTDPVAVVEDGEDYDDPDFAPDGRSLVVSSNRSGFWNLYLLNLETLELSHLLPSEFTDLSPSFSPDGQKIAFQRHLTNDLDWDIFVVNIDGTGLGNLTSSPGPDRQPAWSPDGTRIAFSSGERLEQEIWLVDSDGGNSVQLTPSRPGISGAPSWSPDGTRILFESSEHQGDVSASFFVEYDLYTIAADGTDLRRYGEFSGFGVSARLPAWSPGGDRIAIEVRELGGIFGSRYSIWILNTSTDELFRLPTGGTARKPVWSPLSNR